MRANDAIDRSPEWLWDASGRPVLPAEKAPASPAPRLQRLEMLQGAIVQLPLQTRAVLLLHRRDGYTLDEIAKELGFTRAKAAEQLTQALLHCRRALQSS